MNTAENRIPSLDGLRAISILIVVASHVSLSHLQADRFFLTGNLGVRIFFIISGFLITSILLGEYRKKSGIDLKKFYFRRTFRIFPAYLFFLGFMAFFTILGLFSAKDFLAPLTYTTNYFFASTPGELNHTWSLAVEEQFYLIFPVVLALFGLTNFKRFLLVVLLVTPLIRLFALLTPATFGRPEYLGVAWNFHTNMDILASGCFLALFRNELHANAYYRAFLQSSLPLAVLVPLILLLGYTADAQLAVFYGVGMTVMNFAIVFCIDWLIVNQQSRAGRFLNLRPLKFIGALSYSIYLWQQPFTFYSEISPWTHFPYNLILLSGFSLFTYYFIEKRFLDLRQEFEKKWFPPKEIENLPQTNLNYGSNS